MSGVFAIFNTWPLQLNCDHVICGVGGVLAQADANK